MCYDYGYAWIYEPFSEDPRSRFDPLVFHRERLLYRMKQKQNGLSMD